MDANSLELLKDEMSNDELYLRVNAIHRLSIVATLLGPDGVKNQLIPYLDELIANEEDEVLFAIAQEINSIAPILGGQQVFLIPLLQNLCSQEETVVRERAVSSLISISQNLSDYDVQNHYIPVIFALSKPEANFTCRVSSVHLMVNIYQRAGKSKEQIRKKFQELCSEETPMVRRSVASLIGQFSTVIEKEFVISELITALKQLIQDDQDQVRVLGLNSLKQFAKVLSKEENRQLTLQIIIGATEDKSWRVRLSLSKIFAELADAFGKEVADVSLIQIFTNLLRDAENDVRQASIISLQKFIKIVSAQRLVIILPHLQYLAKDSVPQIRAGTCTVIGIMSGLLNSKEMATQKLLPHLLEMFNDDNKEVREAVMRSASDFCINVGNECVSQFLPHFKKGIEDSKWRVRLECLKSLITIAHRFNNQDQLTRQFQPLIFKYLTDKSAAVREQTANQMQYIVSTYPHEWTYTQFLPKIQENLTKGDSYLLRICALQSLKVVCKTLNNDSNTIEKIFPIFYKHLNDPVPNIRICIIRIFMELLPKYDSSSIKSDIKQHISQLQQDADKDVKFFALEAVQTLSK